MGDSQPPTPDPPAGSPDRKIRRTRTTGRFRFSSKLERKLVRKVGRAVADHKMIEEGDHLLLAVSGGKDSLSMMELLGILARRSPVTFRTTVVTLHNGYQSFSTEKLEQHYRGKGVDYRVEHVPIKQILEEKLAPGVTPCSLCSRIRRGALYSLAPRLGCTKIALGHHLDDLIETLLLNLFYSGTIRAMSPYYRSDDGRNVIIRPLAYVPERWLVEYSDQLEFPVASCATDGCGDTETSRQAMKQLVSELDGRIHGLRGNMLRALQNVRPRHLLDLELLRRLQNSEFDI